MRFSLLPSNQQSFARYMAAAAMTKGDGYASPANRDVRPMKPLQGFATKTQQRQTNANLA